MVEHKFNKWKEENINSFEIIKGIPINLELAHSELKTPIVPINKQHSSDVNIFINVNKLQNAPIYENDIIGKIEIFLNGEVIDNCNIFSSSTIQKKDFFYYVIDILKNYSKTLNSSLQTNII